MQNKDRKIEGSIRDGGSATCEEWYPGRFGAFTLIELLVVIAIIAILAAILLPVLNEAKIRGQNAQSVSNVHQLCEGSAMYVSDNNGYYALNYEGLGANNDNPNRWVVQWLNYQGGGDANGIAGTDDTNTALLTGSMFGPYVQNPAVYRSPLDISCQFGMGGIPRNRSYSMNAAIGNLTNSWMSDSSNGGKSPAPGGKFYTKESQVIAPGASDIYLFLEEHPDSINDGSFAVLIPGGAGSTEWIDEPAKFGNVCPFGFLDTHVELHKWLWPQAIEPLAYTVQQKNGFSEPFDPDIIWVVKHSTIFADGSKFKF